jgi:hypothetical protein
MAVAAVIPPKQNQINELEKLKPTFLSYILARLFYSFFTSIFQNMKDDVLQALEKLQQQL